VDPVWRNTASIDLCVTYASTFELHATQTSLVYNTGTGEMATEVTKQDRRRHRDHEQMPTTSHPPRRRSSDDSLEQLHSRLARGFMLQDNENLEAQRDEAMDIPLPPKVLYSSYVSLLSRYMNHLGRLLGQYKHQEVGKIFLRTGSTSISFFDKNAQRGSSTPIDQQTSVTPISEANLDASLVCHDKILQKLEQHFSPRTVDGISEVKVFIVEDLCPQFLEILGQTFQFPHPVLFAEHLNGSRHKGLDESPSSDWNTAGFRKPFSSIKWYRPVYRRDTEHGLDITKDIRDITIAEVGDDDESDDDSSSVDEGARRDADIEGFLPRWVTVKSRKQRVLRPISTTNILRASLSLSVNSSDEHDVPFLWEEKATIYRHHDDENTNLLMLLDPIPTLLVRRSDNDTEIVIPYRPVRARRHPAQVLPTLINAKAALKDLGKTNSTADDMCESLQMRVLQDGRERSTDPIEALLRIIGKDIKDSFDLMGTALEKISTLSMDE
jgi:hypothetical protein